MDNFFEVLGVEITDNINVLKKAYAKKRREINYETEVKKADELNKAWEVLYNVESRRKHIAELREQEEKKPKLDLGYIITRLSSAVNEGDIEEAEKWILEIEKLGTMNSSIEFLIARVDELKGNLEKALKVYRKLGNISNNIMYDKAIIRCLYKLKNYDEFIEIVVSYSKKYNSLVVNLIEFIELNIKKKKFKDNKFILEKLKGQSEKFDRVGNIIFMWCDVANKAYQCKFSDFEKNVLSIIDNLEKIPDVYLRDIICSGIVNLEINLKKVEQPKEAAIIKLAILEAEGGQIEEIEELKKFILICNEYEKAKSDISVEIDILNKVYLYINKEIFIENGDYEILDEKLNMKINELLFDDGDRVELTIKTLENEYSLLANIAISKEFLQVLKNCIRDKTFINTQVGTKIANGGGKSIFKGIFSIENIIVSFLASIVTAFILTFIEICFKTDKEEYRGLLMCVSKFILHVLVIIILFEVYEEISYAIF